MLHIGIDKTDVYECQVCSAIENIGLTAHVREQWAERSQQPERSIIECWNESIEIFDHGFVAQEARYHHPSRIVLLHKRTDLVTAIDAPTARYTGKVACIQAMVRVGADSTQIAQLCNEAGIKRDGFRQIIDELRAESGDGTASDAVASGRNQHSDSAT
jgi:hypothetical protein